MNQDIQNKIKELADKKYPQEWYTKLANDFRHEAFIEGCKETLSSPELLKDAMVEMLDWVTKSGYDVAGKNVWMAVYGPADDETEFTSSQIADLYIEHLKQKAT